MSQSQVKKKVLTQGEEVAGSRVWLAVRFSIFIGFHFTVLLTYWSGVSLQAVALCVFMYYLRMFGLTAGYHRYFSHRSFKTGRVVQFLFALLGTLCLQKGVLWWAAHHHDHHRYSDKPEDIHSPIQSGFWWSHLGWIASPKYVETKWENIKDFREYPELRMLNRFWIIPFVLLCAVFYLTMGFQALVWGCFVSTVLLFHGTFVINSLAHLIGKRVYETGDHSRNSMMLALITMGEGWHNNHHYYQISARQGFHWWQIDFSWWILWCMEKVGLIWDVRRPTESIINGYLRGDESHLISA